VALWHGGQEILTQQILSIDDVISIVDAVTVDELKAVAKQIFIESGLNLAVTGPVKEETALRQLLKI